MHKSKLGGFIIDCRTDHLPVAGSLVPEAAGALGMPAASVGGSYRKLHDAHLGLNIEVQQVDHPSRVHLDIETDDIEAEVERLETLGAKRLQRVHSWWVMEAPTGQRFCVVQAMSPKFAQQATEWP